MTRHSVSPSLFLLLTSFSILWKIGRSFPINHQPLKTTNANLFSLRTITTSNICYPNNIQLCSSIDRNEDGISYYNKEEEEEELTNNNDDSSEESLLLPELFLLPMFSENDDWQSYQTKLILQESGGIEKDKKNVLLQQWVEEGITSIATSTQNSFSRLKSIEMTPAIFDSLFFFIFINFLVGCYGFMYMLPPTDEALGISSYYPLLF